MQVKKTSISDNEVKLDIIANQAELTSIKQHVLGHFKESVNVPGFRKGKVPAEILEKSIDQNRLQTEFLEEGIGQLYTRAAQEEQLKALGQPAINITKFVPFTTLEFEATLPVLGPVKLADYKSKFKRPTPEVKVSAEDIQEIIKSLQTRLAEKVDVDRDAKAGDQAWIDFSGKDSKGAVIQGAEGKDFPLVFGSKSFIPGFEENVIGMKPGDEKSFELTFPKDYSVAALANKKVTFTVSLIKIQELKLPKADDAFASKVGPFKTLAELKKAIKADVAAERQREAIQQFQSDLVRDVTAKSELSVPQLLVNEQIERMERDEKQNLAYRGQTWQEHLDAEKVTEEQHREKKRPEAEERVKASLVLSEIAEAEKLDVTVEELDSRIAALKSQYQDAKMREELDKPENRRDVASRILTEKTLDRLIHYVTK